MSEKEWMPVGRIHSMEQARAYDTLVYDRLAHCERNKTGLCQRRLVCKCCGPQMRTKASERVRVLHGSYGLRGLLGASTKRDGIVFVRADNEPAQRSNEGGRVRFTQPLSLCLAGSVAISVEPELEL